MQDAAVAILRTAHGYRAALGMWTYRVNKFEMLTRRQTEATGARS